MEDKMLEAQMKMMRAHGLMFMAEHCLRVLVCDEISRFALSPDELKQLEDVKKMLALASMRVKPIEQEYELNIVIVRQPRL